MVELVMKRNKPNEMRVVVVVGALSMAEGVSLLLQGRRGPELPRAGKAIVSPLQRQREMSLGTFQVNGGR